MSRKPDAAKKGQLLDDIIDYLRDRSLSSLTFRAAAEHLGVSPFTLVYHFGTKTELVSEIVEAICDRQRAGFVVPEVDAGDLDSYLEGLRRYWRWTLEPGNRSLQRLEFEAAMLEALDPDAQTTTKATLRGWHRLASDGMIALGVPARTAGVEARAIANIVYGLQYDLVVLGDVTQVDEVFEAAITSCRLRLRELVATDRV